MALKQAKFLSYGNDESCLEIKKFLEDAGVIVEVRDIEKKPLSEDELWAIMGHLDASHFLNPASDSFEKHKLAESEPSRAELIKMVVEDHTLLRRPIIRTARLLTVGCDKQKISEMLKLNGDMNSKDGGNYGRDKSQPNGRSEGRRPNPSN
jgi:arsenate reductase-like glutaredoxin family protein